MNGKILIARNPAALAPCRLCRKPNPAERLSPGAICVDCWSREGAPGGWTLIPEGMALVPMQVIQQANLGAALHSELERFQEEGEPVVLTLLRVLEERRRLMDRTPETPHCVYCDWCGLDADDPPTGLARLSSGDALSDVFQCADREACRGRVNDQLNARMAQRQGQVN